MPKLPLLLALCAASLAACRDGNSSANLGTALPPSAAGASGCNGPNVDFAAAPLPQEIPLSTLQPGPWTQVCGSRSPEKLYLSGQQGQLVEVDVAAGHAEIELLAAGALDTALGLPGPPGASAQLSGLTVWSDTHLVAMEHTLNVLLLIERSAPAGVLILAGMPDESPGFADGLAAEARFHFDRPAQVVATGDGILLVADPGNHAVRSVAGLGVTTLAGNGAPGFFDGSLDEARFDAPVGLCLSCNDTLIISDRGDEGLGGHRLRGLVLGPPNFLGITGEVFTLAGDGSDTSLEGDGEAAKLSAPVSPVSSGAGEVYFVDSGTGILRRLAGGTNSIDCPLLVDCSTPLAGPFTPGALASLALLDSGALYVFDAGAGKLHRINP